MKPWLNGPCELLNHAEKHIKLSSAFDHRIALISIDNSVELAIKTYLALPKRIRKSDGPSRKKLSDSSNSFPDLLDLLEEFASEKIRGIELGDIEWYHRLRNTLYHDGNGITVDPSHVDGYLQIARILLENLFGEESCEIDIKPETELGDLIIKWASFEKIATRVFYRKNPREQGLTRPAYTLLKWLRSEGVINQEEFEKLDATRKLRNEVVHGGILPDHFSLLESVKYVQKMTMKLVNLTNLSK